MDWWVAAGRTPRRPNPVGAIGRRTAAGLRRFLGRRRRRTRTRTNQATFFRETVTQRPNLCIIVVVVVVRTSERAKRKRHGRANGPRGFHVLKIKHHKRLSAGLEHTHDGATMFGKYLFF